MKPSNSPGFNYKRNLGNKVEIRLVRADSSHDNHFVPQFRLVGRTPFHPWHPFRRYRPTGSMLLRPCSHPSLGKWHEIALYVSGKDSGEAYLEYFRDNFHTVGDIYDAFVSVGLQRQQEDLEQFLKYRKESYIPRVFR